MGKFAGFLKRAKKIAGFGAGVLTGINDIYKGIKPFADTVISTLPGGNIINKGLSIGSKLIDKVQPYAKNWINEEDKDKLEKINNNVKRYGGKVTQYTLNKYLDEQDDLYNNKGNMSLGEYGNSIFGNPLN
jgi:hypothetical protein